MQIGMIGLGRMGANMAVRLMHAGHECVVYDRSPEAVQELADKGARGTSGIADLCARLSRPRAVWIMVPAAVVDSVIEELVPHMEAGDIIIDGGNSYYKEDIRHGKGLAELGIRFLDCRHQRRCVGPGARVLPDDRRRYRRRASPRPYLQGLAPGRVPLSALPGASGDFDTAEQGYLHCGPSGAGHFVKMVHNGIEYALMAAYAEGFNLLKHAGVGREDQTIDAETAPLGNPEHYQYDIDVPESPRSGAAAA